jgi:hypothetical protein
MNDSGVTNHNVLIAFLPVPEHPVFDCQRANAFLLGISVLADEVWILLVLLHETPLIAYRGTVATCNRSLNVSISGLSLGYCGATLLRGRDFLCFDDGSKVLLYQ